MDIFSLGLICLGFFLSYDKEFLSGLSSSFSKLAVIFQKVTELQEFPLEYVNKFFLLKIKYENFTQI